MSVSLQAPSPTRFPGSSSPSLPSSASSAASMAALGALSPSGEERRNHVRVFSGEAESGRDLDVRRASYGMVLNIESYIRSSSNNIERVESAIAYLRSQKDSAGDIAKLEGARALFQRQKDLGESVVVMRKEHAEGFDALTKAQPVTLFQRVRAAFSKKTTEEERAQVRARFVDTSERYDRAIGEFRAVEDQLSYFGFPSQEVFDLFHRIIIKI